jgi:chromosome partitioning protein
MYLSRPRTAIVEQVTIGTAEEPFNLANIADFNSLIAQSQKHSIPVFNLSDSQIDRTGFILETMQRSRDNFKICFTRFICYIDDR